MLDLSRVLAGPLCAMQLGDLGADVIKIERPGVGDESRAWGPPWDAAGVSAYFLCCNRNKLGVAADLDDRAGAALVQKLIAGADIVVENFLAEALERRGLGADAMVARNPRLIWCTIQGFARDPTRPGYDYVVQAESGWMSITGEPTGAPMKVGVALADVLAAKEAAVAVLAALSGLRAGAGVQRRVRISLHEAAVAALVNVAQNALVTGAPASRWGNAHPNLVPYELFDAADRPVVIAVGNDSQYTALVGVLGDAALADARFATNAGRVAAREEVVALVRAAIRKAPAAAWMERLREAGVPAGIVRSVRQALEGADASSASGVGPQPPGAVRRPPPALDEHGALVRSRGWDAFAP